MAYVYQDDVLAPKGLVWFAYYGQDPFRIYSGIGDIFQEIFEVKGKDIFEDEFRWDITSDPNTFYVKFHVERKFDKWTKGNVHIAFLGAQPTDPNKKGRLMVELAGWVKTEYPFDTPLQRFAILPFILAYHYAMYNNTRRKYINILREKIEILEEHIRNKLNIPMREKLAEG